MRARLEMFEGFVKEIEIDAITPTVEVPAMFPNGCVDDLTFHRPQRTMRGPDPTQDVVRYTLDLGAYWRTITQCYLHMGAVRIRMENDEGEVIAETGAVAESAPAWHAQLDRHLDVIAHWARRGMNRQLSQDGERT